MPPLIKIRDAEKSYGTQILLDGACGALYEGRNVGLIGRNGCGKSTLAKILIGDEELDSGGIEKSRTLRLGYLRQHDTFLPGETVREFLERDSGQPEWRCGQVSGQFELKNEIFEGPIDELSGGWRMRVKLAALLLHEPNLLILDEPTNFLDVRTQLLLEKFLKGFSGGCLVISHDRRFLKATCEVTWEMSLGKIREYPGNVESYLEYAAAQKEIDRRTNEGIRSRKKQLQTFVDKNRAGANTASQARNKQKQLDRLETVAIESEQATATIRLPDIDARKGTALTCDGLAIGYDDIPVAQDITFDVSHGERLVVVGDNGQGKTTFLRTLCQSLSALEGNIRWSAGCDLGVYAQHVYQSLPAERTAGEYLSSCAASGTTNQKMLDVAGAFLFRGSDIEKRVSVLSGGERARLCLAGLLLARPTVLLLDEPVNHLDVQTVERFAKALRQYAGTVIFTSHDRSFTKEVATCVAEVKDGRLGIFPGGYDIYCESLESELAEDQGKIKASAGRRTEKQEEARPEISAREMHAIQKRIRTLEGKIAKIDEELESLQRKILEIPDWKKAHSLQQEYDSLSDQKAPLEEEWLSLHEQV